MFVLTLEVARMALRCMFATFEFFQLVELYLRYFKMDRSFQFDFSLSVATLKCLDSKNILIRDACTICVLDVLVYSFSSLLRVCFWA